MGKKMNNKYVCGVMNISRMLIGLINETIRNQASDNIKYGT